MSDQDVFAKCNNSNGWFQEVVCFNSKGTLPVLMLNGEELVNKDTYDKGISSISYFCRTIVKSHIVLGVSL